ITRYGSAEYTTDERNQYVLPTASHLASWRTVFQSLLAGAWGTAHLQARTISSPYNIVHFLDTSTGRVFYVVMEGVPGEIPAPADHPSGSVTITDPADPARRGRGSYIFHTQHQRGLSFSAGHTFDDVKSQKIAAETFIIIS